MTILDSVYVGVFGMAVVFIVLLGLSLIIRLQAAIVVRLTKPVAAAVPMIAGSIVQPSQPSLTSTPPELKLSQVDEQTAAMIMAIVCDELKTAPEELYFRAIKKIEADDSSKRGANT